jgi:hypothetical protein
MRLESSAAPGHVAVEELAHAEAAPVQAGIGGWRDASTWIPGPRGTWEESS